MCQPEIPALQRQPPQLRTSLTGCSHLSQTPSQPLSRETGTNQPALQRDHYCIRACALATLAHEKPARTRASITPGGGMLCNAPLLFSDNPQHPTRNGGAWGGSIDTFFLLASRRHSPQVYTRGFADGSWAIQSRAFVD